MIGKQTITRDLAAAMLAMAAASMVLGTDLVVPDDHPTIEAAIAASTDGDVILVRPGTYRENLDLSGRNLTLRGLSGASVTFIEPDSGRCLVMSGPAPVGAGSFLEGFTLIGGEADDGGAITMRDDALSVTDCVFRANHATNRGGALYAKFSTITFRDCLFEGNSCDGEGGGLHSSESLTLVERCIFTENSAVGGEGGGVYLFYADVVMNDCLITDNETDERGGGLYTYKGELRLSETIARNNMATSGGGVFVDKTDAIVNSIIVDGNHATEHGAGMCWIENANGSMGHSTINDNMTDGEGGGIWVYNSRPIFSNCQVSDNVANAVGGLYVDSGDPMPTVMKSAFCGNGTDVSGPYDDGGGNSFEPNCATECPSDINGDGLVDGADLSVLLANWGSCATLECPGDFDESGIIDGADLSALLGAWGPCGG